MKFYICKGEEYTELLACVALPGKDLLAFGLTLRAQLGDVREIGSDDPLHFPKNASHLTVACQSFENHQYSEIDLVTFRRMRNIIKSGIDLVWHQISQQVFPDIWMAFEEYNRKPQTENQEAA